MLYKTGLVLVLAFLCGSQSIASNIEEERQLAANYRRAAQECEDPDISVIYLNKATQIETEQGITVVPSVTDIGVFNTLPLDALVCVLDFMSIKSMARLEESSLGLKRVIQVNLPQWASVKRGRIPHQENISWKQLLLARVSYVEHHINLVKAKIAGTKPPEDCSLFNRACRLGDDQVMLELCERNGQPIPDDFEKIRTKYALLLTEAHRAYQEYAHIDLLYLGDPHRESDEALVRAIACKRDIWSFLDPLVKDGKNTAIELKIRTLLDHRLYYGRSDDINQALQLSRDWLVAPKLGQ